MIQVISAEILGYQLNSGYFIWNFDIPAELRLFHPELWDISRVQVISAEILIYQLNLDYFSRNSENTVRTQNFRLNIRFTFLNSALAVQNPDTTPAIVLTITSKITALFAPLTDLLRKKKQFPLSHLTFRYITSSCLIKCYKTIIRGPR